MITAGPTGRIITGDLFDSNPKTIELLLKDYDSQLYLKWNTEKCEGRGCWEVRRHPNLKRSVHKGHYNGIDFFNLEYVENDIENHIMDAVFLHPGILDNLKKMDQWELLRQYGYTSMNDLIQRSQTDLRAKAAIKAAEVARQGAKSMRSEIKDLKAMLLSGMRPGRLFSALGKAGL